MPGLIWEGSLTSFLDGCSAGLAEFSMSVMASVSGKLESVSGVGVFAVLSEGRFCGQARPCYQSYLWL